MLEALKTLADSSHPKGFARDKKASLHPWLYFFSLQILVKTGKAQMRAPAGIVWHSVP
jgi:hypothetical protein